MKTNVKDCTRFTNSMGTEHCDKCGGLGKNHKPVVHAKALGLRQIELLQLLVDGGTVHVGPLGSTSVWRGDIVYDCTWRQYISLESRGLLEQAKAYSGDHGLSRRYGISKYGRRVVRQLDKLS